MVRYLTIPLVGWTFWLESYDPQIDGPRPPKHSIGRWHEHQWRIPLWRSTFTIEGRGKSLRELTGLPKMSWGWLLDEFDASFNDVAAASLRYHLELSVCDNEAQRPMYQDLIDRLTEPQPTFTDAEMAVLNPPGWTFDDDFEELSNGHFWVRESNPEQKAVYAAHREREDAYLERIRQARHDFVDIMPHLWS